MTEIYTGSRQAWEQIADTVRRKANRNENLPGAPGSVGMGAAGWVWGEFLDDVDEGSWTTPQRGYAKIMVPDKDNHDDPRKFKELGSGGVDGIAGTTITSAAHGLSRGKPVWFSGGSFYVVGAFTTDTFEIVGDGGDGDPPEVGESWYIAVPWTNRDPSLKVVVGAICKLEYGFGEWSQKWVGC